MRTEESIRVAALYFPIILALIAGMLARARKRLFASCLLSTLWAAPALLLTQQLNEHARWWKFSTSGMTFGHFPLEMYLGWVVLWGVLPHLVFRRLPLALCASLMVALDLVLMPLCAPVVTLGKYWLVGEAIVSFTVLVPALCIGRWTLDERKLTNRSTMQIVIVGMTFLYLIPEIAFAFRRGLGWTPLFTLGSWKLQLAIQALLLLAVPGVSAVFEFAERGIGTPIPYDPPKRLVTSGIYRYCANPMQMSCAVVMFAWAVLLENRWLTLPAAVSAIYSVGLAEWDERQDLLERFGVEWSEYRRTVSNWRLRWRPYHSGASARLYIASTCGPCTELRKWIEAKDPIGLDLVAAESLPADSIYRLRYEPADGTRYVEGVGALGRALEHINFGWAFGGMLLRLPLFGQFIQMVMDASGFGPRRIDANAKCEPAS